MNTLNAVLMSMVLFSVGLFAIGHVLDGGVRNPMVLLKLIVRMRVFFGKKVIPLVREYSPEMVMWCVGMGVISAVTYAVPYLVK